MEKHRTRDLVKIAKRENNAKRPYLFVNPLQGKHMPASPSESLKLFDRLSDKAASRYRGEKLLIVGFAETATAIGAAIACAFPDAYYIQTTREAAPGEYIYFSEEHSHAAEQKLCKTGLMEILPRRVIFAEDEVTTGKTIKNMIGALQKEFPEIPLKFGIASIINCMPEETLRAFSRQGIECDYILRLLPRDFSAELEENAYPEEARHPLAIKCAGEIKSLALPGRMDARTAAASAEYLEKCRRFAVSTAESFGAGGKSVLVLGSEEFMYPPLLAAQEIEKNSNSEVFFHATTRSPILPGRGADYPLSSRFELRSIYDAQRTVYVYNLKKYDRVLIVHDAPSPSEAGVKSLMAALREAGNEDIGIIGWSD